MTGNVPRPANAGLNWLLLMPCPLKFPPAGRPSIKLNGGVIMHTGAIISNETNGNGFTVIAIVTATAHSPSVGVNV